jgi:hypothetical protein
MPSSTSNSDMDNIIDPPVPVREVPLVRWGVAGTVALLLFALALGGWE